MSAYSWIREKIENLEITPGQLALEPCSGGAVVSDPQTGEVLACVSYPGYDNNRLANTMDSSYYQQLNTGLSRRSIIRQLRKGRHRDPRIRWSLQWQV